uniref:EndoU domain-containing protein n=1 Tax=Glossina brevipalpis TaxID=37001 RepID=A0A1A9WT30_9MUSC
MLKITTIVLLWAVYVNYWQITDAYKTEIAITPAPIEESTTKKPGFFGGIKKYFRGSDSTTTIASNIEVTTVKNVLNSSQKPSLSQTTTVAGSETASGAQKPPPLTIPKAPLMPLGPRPDTPPSSPVAGGSQQPPQWPQPQPQPAKGPVLPSGNDQRPSLSPNIPIKQDPSRVPGTILGPYQSPRSQPSGIDLSYGGGRPQHPTAGVTKSGGLEPFPSLPATTTTTTTTKPKTVDPQFDLRIGSDSEPTTTKKPSSPQSKVDVKEDFPALPSPKSPTPPTPSTVKPSSPSAWNQPLPTPASNTPTQVTTPKPLSPNLPTAGGSNNRISFVPHTGTTTTIRPGVRENSATNNLATDDEIRALTENLYSKEANSQINLIRVNAQGKTRSIDSTDEAPQPLLEIDARAFNPPTIATMRLLFNNYEMDTMVNEHVTPNERKEENDFVDAVMSTNVMRQAMLFLQNKGIVTPDPKTHRDLVKELWFTQYSRGNGKIGSSGFEHVFVNEVKNGTIIGLHNWVYFYDEEKGGRLDYKGYLDQLDLGTKAKVMKVRFTHNGFNKPVNTLFIGTSPELELALYTVCFQLRPDRTCPVSLGGSNLGIVTYSWRYRGKNLIGSAYPEI